MGKEPKPVETLADLTPDPKNARRHTPRNVGQIETAIGEVGAARSIVIDEQGVVLAGNATIEAAARLGIDRVQVVDADGETIIAVRRSGLSAKQKTRLALFDNRAAETAEWDEGVLAELAQTDALEGMFTEAELGELLAGLGGGTGDADAEPQVDRADELRQKWGTATGQVWELGAHRLAVGDCTDAAVVELLMDGAVADVLFTSPPYAQQREYKDSARESLSDWDALMVGALATPPLADTGQVLVNLGMVHEDGEWLPYWDGWIGAMREAGWRRFGWYVWDQLTGLPGDWSGRFAPCFEFVFHFNRGAVRPGKTVTSKTAGQRTGRTFRSADGSLRQFTAHGAPVQATKIPDSIVRVGRLSNHGTGHPATFPPGLPTVFLEAWPGDVYDPFVGSGTTIIAAENLGRRCYAIEIDPGYAAVSIQRWHDATGGEPRIVVGAP